MESVEKQLSARSHQLLPRKCWELVFLASECVGSLSKIYLGVFPASPGTQIQEIAERTFSNQLDQIRSKCPIGSKNASKCPIGSKNVFFDPIPDLNNIHLIWIEKVRTVIFATGPLEKRETPPDETWRELRHILRRERTDFNMSGATAHANVLKGTFSTDWESDCIRIGLSVGLE